MIADARPVSAWRRRAQRIVLLTTSALAAAAAAPPARADDPGIASDIPISGAGGSKLTLGDAVSRALEHGYDAVIAQIESDRAQESAEGLRGAYYPQLSVAMQAGYSNRQQEKLEAFDSDGTLKKYGLANMANEPWLAVVVEQIILDLSRWRRVQRQDLEAEAARLAEVVEREAIAFVVTRSYADLLRLESLVRASQQRVEEARWLDSQAELLLEAGRALDAERERVAIHLAEAEMIVESLAGRYGDARAALWAAIGGGEPPSSWPTLDPASVPALAVRELPAGVEQAVQRAPELRVLDLKVRVEEANVAAARADRYPKLALQGGYNHYGINRYDNFADEAFIFVGMEVPVFDGFQIRSAISGAKKTAELARLRHKSALQRKTARVRELTRRLETANRRAAIAERRVAVVREQQRLADLRLRAQRAPLADSLAAREQTLREVVNAVDSRYQRIELWATLEREMGGLVQLVAPSATDH
jgi:outer membrane protein TolC